MPGYLLKTRTYWPGGRQTLSEPMSKVKLNKELERLSHFGAAVDWKDVAVFELKAVSIASVSKTVEVRSVQ